MNEFSPVGLAAVTSMLAADLAHDERGFLTALRTAMDELGAVDTIRVLVHQVNYGGLAQFGEGYGRVLVRAFDRHVLAGHEGQFGGGGSDDGSEA